MARARSVSADATETSDLTGDVPTADEGVLSGSVSYDETAGEPAEAEPVKVRKPRVPKPVNDVASASAAFKKAARVSAKADQAAADAVAAAGLAKENLTAAAQTLKGFTAEIDAAADAVLPGTDEDVQG